MGLLHALRACVGGLIQMRKSTSQDQNHPDSRIDARKQAQRESDRQRSWRQRATASIKQQFVGDERGIQWTLEAFLAVLVLFATLTFTASTIQTTEDQRSERFAEVQLSQEATDLLDLASASGSSPNDLKGTALYWDGNANSWKGADYDNPSSTYYTSLRDTTNSPDHPMLPIITDLDLNQENIAYNINVIYENSTGDLKTQRVVYQGRPSGNAISESSTVFLYDDDEVIGTDPGTCGASSGYPTLEQVNNNCDIFMPDADSDGNRYNTVRIEITLWRM